MEYGQRDPIKGESAQEPTAFTMKTIKELLEEEIAKAGGVVEPTPKERPAAAAAPAQSQIQRPPHMAGPARVPAKPAHRSTAAPIAPAERTMAPAQKEVVAKVQTLPEIKPAEETQTLIKPAKKPRLIFGRLIGG